MIARFSRHIVELVIALYALLGFVFVPLGERTGLEHVRAILATGAAQEAIREFAEAVFRVRHRLLAEPKPSNEPRDSRDSQAQPTLSLITGASDAGADVSLAWHGSAPDR